MDKPLTLARVRNLAVKNGYRVAYTRAGYILSVKRENENSPFRATEPMPLADLVPIIINRSFR